MGCDIHMCVEVLKAGVWTEANHFTKNKYFDECPYEEEYELAYLLERRDYTLFSVLANVRTRADNIIPISDPKGLPANISDLVKFEFMDMAEDAHSASHLTLHELKCSKHFDILKELIVLLTQRQNEFSVYGEEKDDKIRIVFWFDN